ncbi:Isovaleryl-CoA dehydrogenase / Butyryl-CoA dehydrogenase [Qipengyuania citrea LAMA 915]|jgi:isovaleryl-CoA dehydrogenase|uniref:Isovaleryl-CoA dehydrogenase, mitochondrial n=1 Tax=Qipengyuania citrea LAMA 915 TaxID=1306953 RepID=A0A0L1KAF8_9SPHN|nr:isovaleryl-CoA dehydrogenase [Qipengyuania citrea]KNH00911.1 Isovaleryl-CoA dehydrogenase / Butyryl-CoA dehydrogenase [Qipengyuania citrea LAMA 915]
MRATPDFDFQLGESAEMIRDTVARFADEQIAPQAEKIDREDYFPREELWRQMGELGLHGLTVDEADGGLGLGYLEHVIAVEEVSRASASLGLSYGAHSNLCINQIRRWGNAEQKAKYLPPLISGEHVGSLAMSEVSAGSDVVSMKLKAEAAARDGVDGYILNGTKFWITNAPHADTLVVYAKTDGSAGSRGITAFLIEKDDAGFSIGQKIEKVGMRGSPTAELVFDDCFVPEDRVMGPLNGGVGVLMSGLDYERVVLSGIQLGIMQACLDTVIPYLRERKQFGKPIGSFQLMQAKVADMYVALQTARAYTYAVAKACDADQTTRFDAAGVILYSSESAFRVAAESVQALGGAGYTLDWPVERYMRDAKLLDIGAGTNEIRRMLIGRELIGAAG